MGKLKVLVVDDEKPARETLTYLIDWDATAFEIIATAKNGRDALEKYHTLEPDLIITDIQMPVMDGLSLIKAIKQVNKTSKFVILSCHEQFSYARAAIQMGVTDYLIKDLITPQDMYTVLVKVQKELEDQKVVVDDQSIVKLNEYDEYYDASRTMAMKAIVLEERSTTKKQALIEQFELDIKGSYLVLLIVCLEKKAVSVDYSKWVNLEKNIFISIKNALEAVSGGECFYYQNGEFIVIAKLEDSVSELKYISKSYEIAHGIYRNIQAAQEISVTIGISRGFYGFDDISQRYKEAQEVTRYKMFLGKGKIIFYNTVFTKVHSLNNTKINQRVKQISQALEENDFKRLSQEVRMFYREDLQGYMQYNYLQEINAHLYSLVMVACNIYSIRYEDLFGCNYIPIQQVEDLDSAEDIGEWFNEVFVQIITRKSRQDNKKYNRHIKAAIKYITSNYTRDIGLSEIAEAISLHKVYLSRLFKHETGDNLVNYIMKVRIEEAKRLILTTDNKLYKIAELVGYNNIQQFSAAFKKITGVTPSEYRDSNMHDGYVSLERTRNSIKHWS
ncbi:hypothetical protein JCM17380_47800 [Desulfosporosinus burensis]